MPSYLITGVSKGLGWEFLNQISADSENTVIGIVRNKVATDARVSEELHDRSNITILEADLSNYASIKKAAEDASKITGGRLDYLIANAGRVSAWDAFDGIGSLGAKPEELTENFREVMDVNVLGNIHLYNLFMPQILNGTAKKVVAISSGHADPDLVNNFDIEMAPLYATSKMALNMITAKFSAQYKKDGVLFLSICPGMVDVGHFTDAGPKEMAAVGVMVEKFKAYAPSFEKPDTPPQSIKAILSVVKNSSIEGGHGGAFLSHFGDKTWLR